MKMRIPYGRGFLETEHPAIQAVFVPQTGKTKALMNQTELVRDAMSKPIASKQLCELAKGKRKALIIISDHTRPVPSRLIIPAMLEELRRGNAEIEITLLVATGCHRGSRREELIEKLGEEIAEQERIVVHDCDDTANLISMGMLPSGAELLVNRLVTDSDLVIAEGFIEPHFFAGFSGGRKSILPGVCGRKTVLGNHCGRFIASPYARQGCLKHNPIHEDMEFAARIAGLQYIVNVVMDEEKHVIGAFAGDPFAAHFAGCEFLKKNCGISIKRKYPVIITSNGGAPLDQNIYQAVKCMTAAEAAAEEKAVLIVCAECADGIGGDSFYRAVRETPSIEALLRVIEETAQEDTVIDQWQYQILARILQKHKVVFVTRPELKEAVTDMKMQYASNLPEAIAFALHEKGADAEIAVIPNGVSVIVNEK